MNMQLIRRWIYFFVLIGMVYFFFQGGPVLADKSPGQIQSMTDGAHVDNGTNLWHLLKAGGWVMIVLFAFSLLTVALIVYNFMLFKSDKIAPVKCAEDIIQHLEQSNEAALQELCASQKNIFTSIVTAGLERQKRGTIFAKEAMENCARNEIVVLWQNISYLADISTIAPLAGLLGTVLGMIQAFNAVAVQSASIKPIMLAAGLSKAMVTTAGGLFVAIPALVFFSYFKGKAQLVTTTVENYTQDIIKEFVNMKEPKGSNAAEIKGLKYTKILGKKTDAKE